MSIFRLVLAYAFTFFAVAFALFSFNRLGLESYSLAKFYLTGTVDKNLEQSWNEYCKRMQADQTDNSPLSTVAQVFIVAQNLQREESEDVDSQKSVSSAELFKAANKDLVNISDCSGLLATYEKKIKGFPFHLRETGKSQQSLVLDDIGAMYAKRQLMNSGPASRIRIETLDGLEKLTDSERTNLLKTAYRLQQCGLTNAARSILEAGAYLEFHRTTERKYRFVASLQNCDRFTDTATVKDDLAKFRSFFRFARIVGMYVLSAIALLLILSLLLQGRGFKTLSVLYLVALVTFLFSYATAMKKFRPCREAALHPQVMSFEDFVSPAKKDVLPKEIRAAILPSVSLQNGDSLNFSGSIADQRNDLLRSLYTEERYHPDFLGRTPTFFSPCPLLFHVTGTQEKSVFNVNVYAEGDRLLRSFQWDSEKVTLTETQTQENEQK